MPKKINLVFEDAVFEKICQLKKKEGYAKYISQLVDDRFKSTQKKDGEGENGEAEVLQVSSEKLLSILNAINDRFTNITGLGERMENLERASEGLAEVVDSIERIAFENKEYIEKLKIAQEAILERFDIMIQNDFSSPTHNKGVQGMTDFPGAGNIGSAGTTPDIDYEFACPQCDGTVDENDYYCRWCTYALSEGGEDQRRDYTDHHERPGSAVKANYDYDARISSAPGGNARPGEWTYDLDDRFNPPTGPPPGWNSENIQIDGSGKPVCPFCLNSMTFVLDYDRWFCEPCWYYAPADFMVSKSIEPVGSQGKPAPKKKMPVLTKKKKNWKNKKLGELPLFKKKRDRK